MSKNSYPLSSTKRMLSLSIGRTGASVLLNGEPSMTVAFGSQVWRGIKYLKLPPLYKDIKLPENRQPTPVPSVPTLPNGQKNIKMTRMINLMRYPEKVHNKLIYEQYGIQAIRGGRLKICHFDVIRFVLNDKLDFKRQFVKWRVDSPWQSCTKRPIGFTLGGGKGNIHHYVTPVAPDRIIFELGGLCEFEEVKDILAYITNMMPFKARPVSHKMLIEEEIKEKQDAERNMNPWTWEYMIKNNMCGCRSYVKKIDYQYFGKYI